MDLHLANTTITGLSEVSVADIVVERRESLEEMKVSFNILLAAIMAKGRFNMVGR